MDSELVNTRKKSGTYHLSLHPMNDQPKSAQVARHPLAGKTLSGADTVVQVLADEGVDTVFGYSGGAILPIYDAVFRYNDQHVDPDAKAPASWLRATRGPVAESAWSW